MILCLITFPGLNLYSLLACWPLLSIWLQCFHGGEEDMGSWLSLGRACGDVMRLVYGEAVAFGQGQRGACDSSVSSSSVCVLMDGVWLLRPWK